MSGFSKPCRLGRFSNRGETLLYVRDNIPSRILTEYKVPEETECMFAELSVRNKNDCCAILITLVRAIISHDLGFHGNSLVLEDLNGKMSEKYLDDVCDLCDHF